MTNSSIYMIDPGVYAMSIERAESLSFVSHYNHTGSLETDRLANNLSFTNEELLWLLACPPCLQIRAHGWGGVGLDASSLPLLMPALLWAVFFVVFRIFCQKRLFRLGLYLQVVVPKLNKATGKVGPLTRAQHNKLHKFQNQVWLAVFYTASSIFGFLLLRDKPYFGMPLREQHYVHFISPHPYNPGPDMMHYYHYGLGFYISELVTLLFETHVKRKDFLQYVLHHITTIALMVLSHCQYDQRIGSYVLFIHDISDIMLAVSKSLHYVVEAADSRRKQASYREQNISNSFSYRSWLYSVVFSKTCEHTCFAVFIAIFAFFRLICLPSLAMATVVYGAKFRSFTVSYWFQAFLLHVVLQFLHLYWSFLIVRVLILMSRGDSLSDLRSEDEEDSPASTNLHTMKSQKIH